MAFNLENMTIDYKKMLRMIPSDRTTLAQSGAISDLISSLTPGQLVNLFPRYYRDRLPDIGKSVASYGGALSGGNNLNGGSAGGGGSGSSYTAGTTKPPKSISAEEKALQELFQKAKVGQYADLPKGKIGLYRPAYSLTNADLSDEVIRTIAGEARLSSKEGVDAVINVMLNRVGSDQYGSNLLEVASQGHGTQGVQFEGFNKGKVSEEQAEYIRQRIKILSSGAAPDNTFGANEFRGDYYVYGEGRGKDFYRDAEKQGFVNIGGNIFAARGNYSGPYQGYDQTEVQERLQQIEIESASQNIQTIETAMGKFEATMIDQLDERLKNYYTNADPIQKKNFEDALGKLGPDQFNETMKRQPVNSATLQAVSISSDESRVSEEQAGYRSSPLKPELRNALEYAAEQSGLYVKVFSGGQTEEQQAALAATGSDPSNRHDIQNPDTPGAADIRLAYKDVDGNEIILDQSNPEHWPMIAEFVKNSSRTIESAGVGGWSPNDNYMGKMEMHIGGPNKKGDAPLAYQGMEFFKQAHAEGVALREQDQKNDYDPLAEWTKKKQEENNKKAEEAVAARVNSDPVTAAQNNMQQPPTELPALTAPEIPAVAAPGLSIGGTVPMTPGENIAGVNTTTGKLEFMSNDRELYTKDDNGDLRVDPSTIRQEQPAAQSASTETQRMETLNQPMQRKPEQPMPVTTPDPNFLETMSSGSMASSPSQLRALNRAKLYGDNSGNLVNGHFT